MEIVKEIGNAGLVPVVVIEDAARAADTAKALLDGGLNVMEITMRTAAAIDAIKNVLAVYPDMLVGAGTVLSVEAAKKAVEAGAKFIVAPGFNEDVVKWCVENDVPITPGCVTPSEIDKALGYGLKVLKYFPANVYGGVKGCAALYAPYKSMGIKFIPTGGVNNDNLADFASKPFIHAIGGGWLCKGADINNGNYQAITATVKESMAILHGFEVMHVGINMNDEASAKGVAGSFCDAFGFAAKDGSSSVFAGKGIEVMKSKYLGTMGHIAVATNSIARAIPYLTRKGYEVDMATAKYKGDAIAAVYLKNEIGGFAVHLLQK